MAYGRKRRYRKNPLQKKFDKWKKNLPKTSVTSVTPAVKNYVKKTLHKNIENKIATFRNAGTRLYNITNDIASWRTQNYIYLSPRASGVGAGGVIIAQGVGQGARIGNKINIRKATLSYVMYPYSANYGTSQGTCVDVNVYIFKVKSMNDPTLVQALIEDYFFQNGSSAVGLTGTLEDAVLKMNTDVMIPYRHWVEKLAPATVGAITSNSFNSNDYKYNIVRKIDVTKYLYKTYDFDDLPSGSGGNPDQPNNDATILMFSPVSPQNLTGTAGASTFYMSYNIQVEYEDA